MQTLSMLRRASARGAALVETALVLCFCLCLILCTYQLGWMEFTQLNLDAAADSAARIGALGLESNTALNEEWQPAGADSWVQQHLSQGNTLTIQAAQIQQPGYIDCQACTTTTTPNGAVGGFSFTIPFPTIAVAQNPNNVYLGWSAIPLMGFGIESSINELCPHVCANGVSLTYANSVNYFDSGDDTAPYFMSFNYMRSCYSNPNWDLTQAPLGRPSYSWDTCFDMDQNAINTSTVNLRALGTAAHLDSSNAGYQLAGGTLQGGPYLSQPPALNNAGPFYEEWCHRRIYIYLENIFNAYQNYANVSSNPMGFYQQWFGTNPANGNPLPGTIIYSSNMPSYYDNNNIQSYNYNAAWPTHTNAGWDAEPLTGGTHYATSPANALTPWYGCGIY